jgi:hypothetical protein
VAGPRVHELLDRLAVALPGQFGDREEQHPVGRVRVDLFEEGFGGVAGARFRAGAVRVVAPRPGDEVAQQRLVVVVAGDETGR